MDSARPQPRVVLATPQLEQMVGRLLGNVAIRVAIEEAKQATGKAVNVTKNWVIQEVAQASADAEVQTS